MPKPQEFSCPGCGNKWIGTSSMCPSCGTVAKSLGEMTKKVADDNDLKKAR